MTWLLMKLQRLMRESLRLSISKGECMDREFITARQIYNRYVVDDGWSEIMPVEIIEVIDLHLQMAKREAERKVLEEHSLHKGEWLNAEVAKKYHEIAWGYLVISAGQYVGKVRELGEELQKKYGVTELEAINILRNNNVSDYVNKYYRIQHLIPLQVDAQRICDDIFSGYIEMAI